MAATNPAYWVSLKRNKGDPARLGLTRPRSAGFRRTQQGWVSSNPTWLGLPCWVLTRPSLAGFPRTQQGWVPTNPAGSRQT
ncbi:hypothetical protein SLEP1_g32462 [Rubroshorea leprosula]|uniref:Uncharacterized protein n=1 Tax=Rubroshorea leprosula TaxID=152421 RepID=A0AAV5KDE9_9ROSI|nr:hypothetical protein SLEP1_g32462 [Rubroshorea leprosula]